MRPARRQDADYSTPVHHAWPLCFDPFPFHSSPCATPPRRICLHARPHDHIPPPLPPLPPRLPPAVRRRRRPCPSWPARANGAWKLAHSQELTSEAIRGAIIGCFCVRHVIFSPLLFCSLRRSKSTSFVLATASAFSDRRPCHLVLCHVIRSPACPTSTLTNAHPHGTIMADKEQATRGSAFHGRLGHSAPWTRTNLSRPSRSSMVARIRCAR